MAKFRAYATVSGGKYLGVFEAETAEDARELAENSDRCFISLCHCCSRQVDGAEVVEVSVEPESDEAVDDGEEP